MSIQMRRIKAPQLYSDIYQQRKRVTSIERRNEPVECATNLVIIYRKISNELCSNETKALTAIQLAHCESKHIRGHVIYKKMHTR